MPFLLHVPSGVLFALLLGMFVVSIEVGHWLGMRLVEGVYDAASREQLGTLEAGVLGTLGLILGFSFSLALGRYNDRRMLVIEEAAAISDAYTRAGVLSGPETEDVRRVLKRYVDLRIQAFELRRHLPDFERAIRDTEAMNRELWRLTERASHQDARPVVSLFVASINNLIVMHVRNVAAFSSHVPPLVTAVVVLFATLGTGAMVFASTARCGQRLGMWFVLACMLSSLLLMITDLDRPRVGLIPVNQDAIYYQRKVMR